MVYNFQNTYTKLSPKLFQKVNVPVLENPSLILLNEDLLETLDVTFSPKDDSVNLLQSTDSFAQAYAGHQFGHFTILGDGRAMILGEHITPDSIRYDVQLKGSGVTKYSRGGDGKATASSMLREYIYSYAMQHLGIKTSQSLAVIGTNEPVFRNDVQAGAILIRVMSSHIRVGTFEYAARMCTSEEFQEFTNYVIDRHYPTLVKDEDKYLAFFRAVIKKTMAMVIDWYRVGFIHGVMNTDNMSVVGETFDYGPCAFMNAYDPRTAFSQIDTTGRYCFGNQKDILKWNLGVFGRTLVPLITKEEFEKEMEVFDACFEQDFQRMMHYKLGLKSGNEELVQKTLDFLQETNADYTNFFIELMQPGTFKDGVYQQEAFQELRRKLLSAGMNTELMKKHDPQLIPRNYLVEEALKEFEETQSLDEARALLEAFTNPYKADDNLEPFQSPPPKKFDKNYSTHCNT